MNNKILFYLLIAFCIGTSYAYSSGCDLPENSIYLNNNEVIYNVDFNIGGFQFTIDGTTISDAYGGDAESAGFSVEVGTTTVLGFSFTASSIPSGCGILTLLDLDGPSTGISNPVFSDENGINEIVMVPTLDCNGDYNGAAVVGCDNVCGSGLVNDECGVCDGPGSIYECGCYDIPDGDCDCFCNVLDDCGICAGDNSSCSDCSGVINGNGLIDGCGVCNGDDQSCEQAGHLLFSKIVTSPNAAEMIEIYNPTDQDVWLKETNSSHPEKGYYLTDATNPNQDYYYNFLPNLGGENFNSGQVFDFFVSFPPGTKIESKGKYVVSMHDNNIFNGYYNANPDNSIYNLHGDGYCHECNNNFFDNSNLDVLGDNGEVLILFYWDGESTVLQDVDYFLWGNSTYGVDKTGIGDFNEDTPLSEQIFISESEENYSYVRIINEELGQRLVDGNGINNQDQTGENLNETWIIQANEGVVFGCMDNTECLSLENSCGNFCALNYNPYAVVDDGQCEYNYGCMDLLAENYDPQATKDDDSCTFQYGCTDEEYGGICEFDGQEDLNVFCNGHSTCEDICDEDLNCLSSQCNRKGNFDATAKKEYNSCTLFDYPSVELMLSDYNCGENCTSCYLDSNIAGIANSEGDGTCDAAEYGHPVSVYGKLIDYYKINETFWKITIADDNGYKIDIVPGYEDDNDYSNRPPSNWVISESFLSYLVDPYNYSEHVVSIYGIMGEYEGSPQMGTWGREETVDDFLRYYSEGKFIDDVSSPITAAEIIVAPYVLIPSLGERINFMYSFPDESRVIVRIFNLDGRYITSLVDQYYESSGTILRITDDKDNDKHTSSWDGRDHLGQIVSPGTYLMHIEATNFKTGYTSTDVAPVVVGVPN